MEDQAVIQLDKICEQLQLFPLSTSSSEKVEEAFRNLRTRYPGNKRASTAEVQFFHESEPLGASWRLPWVVTEWKEYATVYWTFPEGSVLWELEEYLGQQICERYLSFLRTEAEVKHVRVQDVRVLGSHIDLSDVGIDRPTAIPFRDKNNNWAFAVADKDVIHWFDSGTGIVIPRFVSETTRRIETMWTGPKHSNPLEAATFMLMGIWCFVQGCPHLDQETADELKEHFQVRILIEMLCNKYDASSDDFENMKQHGSPALPHSPVSLESSHPVADIDYRKLILDYLSEATVAYRSRDISGDTNLTVLWSLVKNGTVSSTFYDRYYSVLYYDKIKHLTDDRIREEMRKYMPGYRSTAGRIRKMKEKRDECKLWDQLCDLQQWEEAKYILLCTIPRVKDLTSRDEMFEQVKSRLDNPSDQLRSYLEHARGLCCALVGNSLPRERLMIENYPFWTGNFTDEVYKAFVSIDPHVRLALDIQ